MIAHAGRTARRSGLTLLEVLLSLAILLFSLVALSQLVGFATDSARDVQWQSRSTRLAQSKLNEVVAGGISLTTGGSGFFEEEEEWEWSVEAQSDSTIPNLYLVTVRVWRTRPDGVVVETVLTQYVTDPTQRGGISQQDEQTQSTQDSSSPTSPAQSSQTTPSSPSGSSGSTPSTGGATGGGSIPQTGGTTGGGATRPTGGTTGGGNRPTGGSKR